MLRARAIDRARAPTVALRVIRLIGSTRLPVVRQSRRSKPIKTLIGIIKLAMPRLATATTGLTARTKIRMRKPVTAPRAIARPLRLVLALTLALAGRHRGTPATATPTAIVPLTPMPMTGGTITPRRGPVVPVTQPQTVAIVAPATPLIAIAPRRRVIAPPLRATARHRLQNLTQALAAPIGRGSSRT